MPMTRYIYLIKITIILLWVLCGCISTLKSGRKYVIEEVKGTGYVIKFKGLDELFTIPVNTHRVGDTITVKRTKQESKATIY